MSNHICRLLEETPSGTAVKELMMNGEDVSKVEEFVKYDRNSGLVYFTNKSNNVFVAIAERIDMIEFEFGTEETSSQRTRGRRNRSRRNQQLKNQEPKKSAAEKPVAEE